MSQYLTLDDLKYPSHEIQCILNSYSNCDGASLIETNTESFLLFKSGTDSLLFKKGGISKQSLNDLIVSPQDGLPFFQEHETKLTGFTLDAGDIILSYVNESEIPASVRLKLTDLISTAVTNRLTVDGAGKLFIDSTAANVPVVEEFNITSGNVLNLLGNPAQVRFYRNGLRQEQASYNLIGNTVTFTTAVSPQGEHFTVEY